jgi:hypothetical protein
MRRAYQEAGAASAVVIAHASMPETSTLMVDRGADFALPKPKGEPISPPIAAVFGSVEAVEYLVAHRRPMPPRVRSRAEMLSTEDLAEDGPA